MHEFGITSKEIAAVSVSDRHYAHLNEKAQYRDELTVEDVLNSRLIADPLHLLDCSPVSDGGCAVAIAKDRRFVRRDRAHPAVLRYANAMTHAPSSHGPSYAH